VAGGDAEVVRDIYALFNAGETQRSTAMLHPDVELHQWEAIPDTESVSRGREGFVASITNWLRGFEPGFQFTPVAIREVGERVLMEIHLRGRGRGSGVEIEQTLFHVWEVRDGLGYRCEVFISEADAEARAAAGEAD
jgi:ketosteroid isomerase-like protein